MNPVIDILRSEKVAQEIFSKTRPYIFQKIRFNPNKFKNYEKKERLRIYKYIYE